MTALEPGNFVALHGMPVAGKSTLAADAVRDPEITLQVNEKCVMIFLSLYTAHVINYNDVIYATIFMNVSYLIFYILALS